jgi:hypothetical protein
MRFDGYRFLVIQTVPQGEIGGIFHSQRHVRQGNRFTGKQYYKGEQDNKPFQKFQNILPGWKIKTFGKIYKPTLLIMATTCQCKL